MKRIFCFILAVISLFSLTSCSSVKPEDKRVVLTLSGEKIYYDYFRYVFLNAKRDMDGGDGSYWASNPEKEASLKEGVLDTLLQNRAIQLLAKEYKIKLNKDEKKAVKEQISALKENKEYEQSLKDAYMTEYTLNYLQTFTALWSKTYDYVTSEESGIIKSDDKTVLDDIPINSRRIRYIMINFDSENKEEKRELAEAALKKAQNGEDFTLLVKEYCDDMNMKNVAKDGYYYTRTQIIESIENQVEKLNEGSISEICEISGSFFIIQRLEIDYDYVEKNFNDFITQYKARVFNEMLEDIKKEIKPEYSDIWNGVGVNTVK